MRGIYHFEKVSDTLACAGQPTEEQFRQLVAGQYQMVINLGLLDTKYALPDEADLVPSLGVSYHHIPVIFEKPQLSELDEFITVMDQNADKKILVHCAANYRASVFTGLYLLSAGKLAEEEIHDFVDDVWQPNTIWQQFLQDGIKHISNQKT